MVNSLSFPVGWARSSQGRAIPHSPIPHSPLPTPHHSGVTGIDITSFPDASCGVVGVNG
ncbi:MAG TPA: hypothetical protein VLA84_08640 [Microcoleus sp.]|nr:hypothetical protein [Microcoleus sp.]